MITRTKLFLLLVVFLMVQSLAWAQKAEVTISVGARLGGSLDLQSPGQLNSGKLELDDSISYGLGFGYKVAENFLVNFEWSRQSTDLFVRGGLGARARIGNTKVDLYHGQIEWDLLDEGSQVQPYIVAGLGATRIAPGGFNGRTNFSPTLGGGAKFYFNRNVGLRFQARVIPTHIGSSTAVFCSSAGICYAASKSFNVYQGDLTGGVVFRF
jgi:hypothetical protein